MPELSAEEQEQYDNATECHICGMYLQVCIIIYGCILFSLKIN